MTNSIDQFSSIALFVYHAQRHAQRQAALIAIKTVWLYDLSLKMQSTTRPPPSPLHPPKNGYLEKANHHINCFCSVLLDQTSSSYSSSIFVFSCSSNNYNWVHRLCFQVQNFKCQWDFIATLLVFTLGPIYCGVR